MRLGLGPLAALPGALPGVRAIAQIVASLRILPELNERLAAIAEDTGRLPQIEAEIANVARRTAVLPEMVKHTDQIAQTMLLQKQGHADQADHLVPRQPDLRFRLLPSVPEATPLPAGARRKEQLRSAGQGSAQQVAHARPKAPPVTAILAKLRGSQPKQRHQLGRWLERIGYRPARPERERGENARVGLGDQRGSHHGRGAVERCETGELALIGRGRVTYREIFVR
ncbi:MAG TPA: hypothetical protein VKB17_09370 [Thermoleophilaceae bacterium]|nr:hypothetical protein [Thermoleophilaceae bacterium]